jgi:hypothetical protein
MTRITLLALCVLGFSASSFAQVLPYGTSTPAGNVATFDTGGQLPYAGNANFKLTLRNTINVFGGGMVLGFAPTSVPFVASTLLVDLNGAVIVTLAPGQLEIPMAVPNSPGLVGYTGFAQGGIVDANLAGGFGLTNAIQVTVMPNVTPTRAYLPGQDFSSGANAPGQMSVLDLSQQPPVFRATGSIGLPGNIGSNYSGKIAVSETAHIAYCLGNGTAAQYARAFDVTADAQGVVTHTLIGDIPVAGDISGSCGQRDMEASSNGQYLFTVTGSGTSTLEVFDVSLMPGIIPTTPVQSITFPNAGGGVTGLDLSPDGNRLAVLMSVDALTTLAVYNVTGGSPPLTLAASIPLPIYSGQWTPAEAHFAPDGRLIFVSGPNGFFSVIDTLPSIPQVLIAAGTWPSGGAGSLWFHGSAVGVLGGVPVGIVAGEGTGGMFHLIDLNMTSVTFGAILTSFLPTIPAANGNISNHRIHARQNIVVAIDGTGATVDCQMVDVIDLDQIIPPGFQTWRVKMPSFTTLTPGGLSSIPRDFDMF